MTERLIYGAAGAGVWCAVCFVFYHSLWPGLATLPVFFRIYYPAVFRRLSEKRRISLRNQFSGFSRILAELLLTGYSVENAMEKALGQQAAMEKTKSELTGVLEAMCRQLQVGVAPELLWEEFGRESEVGEIEEFAGAFSLAKQSGASVPGILNRVSGQLSERIRTENQIETMLAGKKLEQRIMILMPAAILLYVSATSPEMLRMMYETWVGRGMMTAFLGIYLFAFWLALRMSRITD